MYWFSGPPLAAYVSRIAAIVLVNGGKVTGQRPLG